MLEIREISSPHGREKTIQEFDSDKTTWVVSDLRSKFSMQQHLLQKFGFFEEASILRASELWTLLLKRAFPDFQIVSRDFVLTCLAQELKKSEYPVARHHSENTVLDMVDSFVQVWTHPNGKEMLAEWLDKNPAAKERWGFWADLIWPFSNQFLSQKKICTRWIAPFLSNNIGWEKFWSRNLIVDLGSELSRPEAELLSLLSRNQDVLVIKPVIEQSEQFSFLFKPYEELK